MSKKISALRAALGFLSLFFVEKLSFFIPPDYLPKQNNPPDTSTQLSKLYQHYDPWLRTYSEQKRQTNFRPNTQNGLAYQ